MSAETALDELKNWLESSGGYFHPHVHFKQVPSGCSVIASRSLPPDSKIVSCPFNLAITKHVALDALSFLLGSGSMTAWTERQLIASYLCFHLIIAEDKSESEVLAHRPYVKSLPSSDKLRTPLHFTASEREQLKGSNLYGATLDREREWMAEWEQCRGVIASVNGEWGERFTWELYLTAATHLSSRAFSSTLLSQAVFLASPPSDPEPILLPGIDSLNHARAEPVSWVQNYVGNGPVPGSGSTISLTLHNPIAAGAEMFNNYGAKPNSELILGYGFSLPNNPDDTIVLRIGGMQGKKWEVARNARGADGVWESVLQSVAGDRGSVTTYEDYLDAAEALADMARMLRDKLPQLPAAHRDDVRPDVALMVKHYVEGQRDIMEDLITFTGSKENEGITMAQEQGIELVLE